MDWSWIVTSLSTVPMILLTAVGIYAGMLLLTRVAGLRSFSKLSAFDFAVTVAIGSILATTVLSPDPPLVQALVALAALYAIQIGVATLRERFTRVQSAVDNVPLLLSSWTEGASCGRTCARRRSPRPTFGRSCGRRTC